MKILFSEKAQYPKIIFYVAVVFVCLLAQGCLEVEEELPEWPESFFRERRWMSVEEAAALVDQKGLRRLIRLVPGYLTDKHGPESG
jgi:hypothetical protein